MDLEPKLEDLRNDAACALSGYLAKVQVGASLPIDPSAELLEILEFLIPGVLRLSHPEWQDESIDGFRISSATKTTELSAEMTGTCILISDQSVTPFEFDLELSRNDGFESIRIRLGESGGGPLGISGPSCTSDAAKRLLIGLNSRLDSVDWVYTVSI